MTIFCKWQGSKKCLFIYRSSLGGNWGWKLEQASERTRGNDASLPRWTSQHWTSNIPLERTRGERVLITERCRCVKPRPVQRHARRIHCCLLRSQLSLITHVNVSVYLLSFMFLLILGFEVIFMQINVNVYVYLSFLPFGHNCKSRIMSFSCLVMCVPCVPSCYKNYCHPCHECQKNLLYLVTARLLALRRSNHISCWIFCLEVVPAICWRVFMLVFVLPLFSKYLY